MTDPQLASVYRQAADVIRINGHCKSWFHDFYAELPPSEARVCTVGALSLVVTGIPVPPEQLDGLLGEAIADLSRRIVSATDDDDPVERIADWNDQPDRTPGEVIALFDVAAKAVAS